MDHSTAHFIDLDSKKKSRSIVSKFTSETKESKCLKHITKNHVVTI